MVGADGEIGTHAVAIDGSDAVLGAGSVVARRAVLADVANGPAVVRVGRKVHAALDRSRIAEGERRHEASGANARALAVRADLVLRAGISAAAAVLGGGLRVHAQAIADTELWCAARAALAADAHLSRRALRAAGAAVVWVT